MISKIFYTILLLCPLISICIPKDTLSTIVIPVAITTPTCAYLQTQTTTTPTTLNMSVLGTSAYYGVLAHGKIDGATPLTIYGSVGSLAAINLNSPYHVYGGTVHAVNDAYTISALNDAGTAYTSLSIPPGTTQVPTFLTGAPIQLGTYYFNSLITLAGGLVINLDYNNITDAVWIFRINGYNYGWFCKVQFVTGGLAFNVYWQISGYCALAANVIMIGNIVSQGYITMAASASLKGIALSVNDYITITGTATSVYFAHKFWINYYIL